MPTAAPTSGRAGTPSATARAGRAMPRYDRIASNADIAGWLLWRNFRVTTALDVGCATGYLVEVLRERGIDAEGCDLSSFAVDHATPGAVGHVRVANLFAGLPWPDGAFELVTTLEILEHLPPGRVPDALGELARVCGGYLYATIPSFGPNRSGPDGHFEGKVRPGAGRALLRARPRVPRAGARARPGRGRRGGARRGPPVHRLLRVVDRTLRRRRVHPLRRRRGAAVRRHRAGRPRALLEPLRVPSGGRRPGVVEPREPGRTLAELGLRHPLLGT